MDADFFTMLDSVTIARSRKHIKKYYNISAIGKFPKRLKPLTLRPKLTDLPTAIDYDEIYDLLMKLNLAVYVPTDFLLGSKRAKYIDPGINIDRAGRESGTRRLMCINLLKRLESSVYSFLSKLIDQRMLFALQYENTVWLAVYRAERVLVSMSKPFGDWNLPLSGLDLGAVWENMIAQIGGIDLIDGKNLDETIIENER